MKAKKVKVDCDRCGHHWETKSRRHIITCPSCRKGVKIREWKNDNIDVE